MGLTWSGSDGRAGTMAAPGPLRIAALIERGRRGRRVLSEVLALAADGAVEVSLVAVVAHASGRGCAVSPTPLNDAIDEAATAELDAAALALPLAIPVVDRRLLRKGAAPTLAEWTSEHGFDVVLVAGRHWPGGLRAPRLGRLRKSGPDRPELRLV